MVFSPVQFLLGDCNEYCKICSNTLTLKAIPAYITYYRHM